MYTLILSTKKKNGVGIPLEFCTQPKASICLVRSDICFEGVKDVTSTEISLYRARSIGMMYIVVSILDIELWYQLYVSDISLESLNKFVSIAEYPSTKVCLQENDAVLE